MTAYVLTTTVSTPLYGKLSDLYGRKVMFQAAIVVFVAGSMLCGIAQDMGQLIAFRGLQGIGGGGLMAMAFAIIGDIIAQRERGRYTGYLGAVFAVASVAGPLLGGFFVDNLSWRWVFYINVPIGVVALAVTSTVLRLPYARREHRIDYLGAWLLVAGVSALLLALVWGGNEYAWGSGTIVGLLAVSTARLVAFVVWEQRTAEPILPMRLFRGGTFSVGVLRYRVPAAVATGFLKPMIAALMGLGLLRRSGRRRLDRWPGARPAVGADQVLIRPAPDRALRPPTDPGACVRLPA